MFALVSPASLCPRDRSELPLKVSCQPPVKQSFYINKMEIWHLKSETLKAPVAFFFFFYGEMSVSTQLCEEHGLSSKKERAHNVPPSIDSFSHANTSHKTLFFLSDFLFFDSERTDLPRYNVMSGIQRWKRGAQTCRKQNVERLYSCILYFAEDYPVILQINEEKNRDGLLEMIKNDRNINKA